MRFKSGLICSVLAAATVVAAVIAGCGGGSGGGSGVASRASTPLPPAGSQLYKGSINAGSSTVLLADPGKNATVTIPAGSMTNGSTVGLTVWNAQRAAAQRSGFASSTRAVDVTINPAALQPDAAITVGLPWQAGADPHTTMMVAFGASGNSTVVAETAASTASSPVACITQAQIQYLTGASSGQQTIEFAVEQQIPQPGKAAPKPALVKLWGRSTGLPATSRTAYASRTRIAIVVPGIYEDDENQSFGFVTTEQDMQPILTFLTTKLPTDGDITASSKPFDPDEVWCFNYDFTQTIESNGAALAAAINLVVDNNGKSWNDPTSFEIHFIAHSMGGLVTRWALEKVGVPAAFQLITLGTPHWGVPSAVLQELSWVALIPLWGAGINELLDDSSFIAGMKTNKRAAGVVYNFISGSSHAGLTFPLGGKNFDVGDPINALYAVVKPVAYNANDGIVPEYSALEGAVPPGAPQPYNHNDLVKDISLYWSKVASTWLYGINRKVKTIQVSPTWPSVLVGLTLQMTVDAFDKDGSQLDPTLISSAYTDGVPVTWSVDNPKVATINPATGVLTGVSDGTVRVTGTTKSTVETTTGKPVSQTVALTVIGGHGTGQISVSFVDTNDKPAYITGTFTLPEIYPVLASPATSWDISLVTSTGSYHLNSVVPNTFYYPPGDSAYFPSCSSVYFGGIMTNGQVITVQLLIAGPLTYGGASSTVAVFGLGDTLPFSYTNPDDFTRASGTVALSK